MPDTLLAGEGASVVTFKEPVVSVEAVMSSTPYTKPYPSSMNVSDISSAEASEKETESSAETSAWYVHIRSKVLETEGKTKHWMPLRKSKTRNPYGGS